MLTAPYHTVYYTVCFVVGLANNRVEPITNRKFRTVHMVHAWRLTDSGGVSRRQINHE